MGRIAKHIKIVITLFILSVFVVLSFSGCIYPHQDAIEYLSKFQRTTDIAVTDYYNVFCFDNKSLNVNENFDKIFIKRIGYVDRTSLLLFSHNNETDKFLIYKTDYELKDKNIIYEFSDLYRNFELLNSDLLFYHKNDGNYYTYEFSTETTNTVEEDFVEKYKESISKYSVSKKKNAFSSETTKYFIKDKTVNIEKQLVKEDFLKVEQAKYLNDKKSFSLGDIYAVEENVYMIGYTNGCAIIFKYDFESNSVAYYSWINTSALISEPRNFYFFT